MSLGNQDKEFMNQAGVRVNKYLSSLGICSRRDADAMVEAGRVTINGEPAVNGSRVMSGDQVSVDDKPVDTKKPRQVYIALNKPVGIVSTTDSREPDNIVDFMSYPERIFPIGRLDKDSDGLILLTNDGDIVNYLLRARYHHEKEYEVIVDRKITPEFLKGMSEPVPILGTMTEPSKIHKIDDYRFRIILTQGLNRQIRRMCEYFGYEVIRLTRWRIMNVTLGNLRQGEWRYITAKEMEQLRSLLTERVNAVDSQTEESPEALKRIAELDQETREAEIFDGE